MMFPRERLDLAERFHKNSRVRLAPEADRMMRIRTIPTSVTLLMLAIILAAPIVTNAFLAMTHSANG
jgi:hypothetical protein